MSRRCRAGRRKDVPCISGPVGRIYHEPVESVERWQANQRSPASDDRHIQQAERRSDRRRRGLLCELAGCGCRISASRIKAMSKYRPDLRTWIAGVVFFGLGLFVGTTLPKLDISKPDVSKLEVSKPDASKPASKKIEAAIVERDTAAASKAGENPTPSSS